MQTLTIADVRTTVVGTPWRELVPRVGGKIRQFEDGVDRRGFGGSTPPHDQDLPVRPGRRD